MAATTSFTSSASLISWDEDRSVTTVPRITPASVKMKLPDLKATVTSTYTMVYLASSTGEGPRSDAEFTFTDMIEGEDFAGQSGSMITTGKGTFDAATFHVQGTFEVVQGSQQGGLAQVFGKNSGGSFATDPADAHKVIYTFTASK